MNAIMTPIFLGDFIYRITTWERRGNLLFLPRLHWPTCSSLPFPQLKILRLFRLWRVIRLFMEFGVGNLLHEFITHRAQNALLTVVFLVLCVLEFGWWRCLPREHRTQQRTLRTPLTIWWAYAQSGHVGYGDFYPVSTSGRIVGIFVMTAGVGLFGTLSGFLANTFLSDKPKATQIQDANAGEVQANDPKARLTLILQKIETQEQAMARLRLN